MSPQTRQLAAIMFTDIEGYTALMQNDEQKAVKIRNRHREIFERATEKFRGKILQYYGDGTLSIFDSAIDAVNCAVEMQLQFTQAPEIPVRIGIHSGDIIYSDQDIIGDGVNIASRIESLAEAGSVLISEKVQDEIKNQRDLDTQSLGSFNLKNVSKPIRVYAISNGSLKVPDPKYITGKLASGLVRKTPNKRIMISIVILLALAAIFYFNRTTTVNRDNELEASIAVIPFDNMSNDPNQQYFSEGITEDIITHLSKITDLKVTSRTSSYKFKSSKLSISEIGKELDVSYILEGSVRKSGDEIRIVAQLINVQSDDHLWAETYDQKLSLDNIFNIQTDVATKISLSLKGKILPHEKELIAQRPTENLEAYEAYLKGSYYLRRYNVEDTKRAVEFFEKAIELDAGFFGGYSGLGNSYALAGTSGYGWLKPQEAIPKAKLNAIKALEINANSGSARSLLGDILYWYEYNWREAEVEYKLAIQLDPAHIGSKLSYALLLSTRNKHEEAIALIDECIEMDPQSVQVRTNAAWRLIEAQRFNEVINQADIALSIDPHLQDAHISKAWACLYTGKLETAQKIVDQWGHWPLKGYLAAYRGETAIALNYLDSLHQRAKEHYVAPIAFAMIYTGLNDTEKAIQYLDSAYYNKDRDLIFLNVIPLYDSLRDEENFQEILTKIGLGYNQ